MKLLERNKTTIHYAPCVDTALTARGEESPVYGDPVPLPIHVVCKGGTITTEAWGKQSAFDCSLLSDSPLPFDKSTGFWIHRSPTDADGNPTEPDFELAAPPAVTPNGYTYFLRLIGGVR